MVAPRDWPLVFAPGSARRIFMKHRPSRVKELIKRELGVIVTREMTFSAKLVTIHAVDLTPDFKNCHVFVGVLGTVAEQREALAKLRESRSLLQHELSRRVILKYTPALHFHFDESFERGTKVMEILRQIDETSPLPPPEDQEPHEP